MQVSATTPGLIRKWRPINGGHGIGVELNVYTHSSVETRLEPPRS
jgi:hypothetical protein